MIEDKSEAAGAPTHYTTALDAQGKPSAVPADHPEADHELPEGWDDVFWEWDGAAWVQNVDAFRSHLWGIVKNNRAAAQLTTPVKIRGRTHTFKSDPVSRDDMRGRRDYLRENPITLSVLWTTEEDANVDLSVVDLEAVINTMEERQQAIHEWSQTVRSQIMDSRNDSIEKLRQINIEYGD